MDTITPKQANYLRTLTEQREPLNGVVIKDIESMSKTEASTVIGLLSKQPYKAGSDGAKRRAALDSVKAGQYNLTAKQAGNILNYKEEPYFGNEAVTVEVFRNEAGAYWMNRVGDVSHPIKDSVARRQIMAELAKKSPKVTAAKAKRTTKEPVAP